MKKMMIVALMAAAASTAFAGDSETLKSILKAKTYAEAESLVKSGLGQLANASEKASAYNKLVDLAMAKVTEVQAVMNANQVAEQMKQGKVVPYDTIGFYTALAKAYDAALAEGDMETAKEQLNIAEKKLMQAAAKGTIHKNAASRKVSRLAKRFNKANA